tara:strand:- start:649 stop:855 length:207 start_codon:yes stop_codon:yes gene_type:complete
MRDRLGAFLYLIGFLITAFCIYLSYLPTTGQFEFNDNLKVVSFAWPLSWILRWLLTGKKSPFYTKSQS